MKKTILAVMALCQCLCIAQAQEANPFGKALVPDMIADASIILADGTFYCYATTDGYGRGLETSGPPTVWKSTDFVHWSFEGNYFPSAAEQKYWVWGHYRGDRIGIYSYNDVADEGWVDVDYLHHR